MVWSRWPILRCAVSAKDVFITSCRIAGLFFLLEGRAHADEQCTKPSDQTIAKLRRDVDRNLLTHSRAIERVHTEGTLPHQGIWDQSVEAEKDWTLMRQLAQLWQASHRPEDAKALSQLLDDWARTYRPSFNPIDETKLDAYIDAYAMTRDALDSRVKTHAQQFIKSLGEGYLQQMEDGFRPNDGRWINNWNSHRIKLATLAAAALDDKAMWQRARQVFITHLARNIRANGITIDFEERDALHYVVYDMEPLVRAAQVAQWYNKEDWLALKGSNGGSIAVVLNWLEPYAQGKISHEEFVHSKVKFDAERNAAGVTGFSGPWEPTKSAMLYAMAAILDTRYAELALKPNPDSNWIAPCWIH